MALSWIDKQNNIDTVDADDINGIAHAVEDLELVAHIHSNKEILDEISEAPVTHTELNAYATISALEDGTIQPFNALNADLAVFADQATLAERATADVAGNDIMDTYATKAEVGNIETALDGIIAIQNALIGGGV